MKFFAPQNSTMSMSLLADLIADSIIIENDNVWTTVATTPETYGAEVVRAESFTGLPSPPAITSPSWQWKPDNPYNIITGAIEVEKWRDLIMSIYSMLTFVMLGTIGGVISWVCYMAIVKKKRWSLRKKKEVKGKCLVE